MTSAGDSGGPKEPGGDPGKPKGKSSSSYPPIFRAKAGESYRDWKRAVGFWLGGEGNQIREEYIGPRLMVQLRDRAAQLVKHLNNEDVNMAGGMQKIFDVLEKSPLVNFNQRLSGDCFHVWDIAQLRYTVVHFIDELTDYQIATVTFDATSGWVAEFLRTRWYEVFGPPEVLLTDAGLDFRGQLGRLNDLWAVRHEVVPDGAKWRMGHVERHGAILKLMIMKTVQEMRIDKTVDMETAVLGAVAAKNRLVTRGGWLRSRR